ncbi:tetratricopeptide repeat protein [Oligoflexus tunisiensis]|uniref:tetratricopeptide repeat protein n=1 Tax=Oligoflexus tunisiensis TaxID=708132 RepID=UPI001C402181|nr:hypothetical protein [Oligoflexus tunisiensis]
MPRPSWKIIRFPKERLPALPDFRLGLAGLAVLSSSLVASEIRDDLPQATRHLQERMEALRAAEDKETMGVVLHAVDQAFALAEQNLKEREYIAVIRNLNYVLNQAPQLPQERYMRAHYMLGTAYEELKQISRAGKAWLRYLSSFTTQQGDENLRLLEVIRRVLLIQEQLSEGQRSQLQRLLADITALQMAPEIRAEIHLLAAMSAIHNRNYRLADSWLEKVRSTKASERLWAEASFYAGLSAMKQGKEQDAEKIWLEVAGVSDESLIMIRDLAALNLGRLYAARKMPKHALQWYAKVKFPGLTTRLAAYEVTLLLAQNKQFAEAGQFAQSYISNYPNTAEAHELKESLPLFLYQAGHLDLAESRMRDRDKALTELKDWLEVTTRGKLAVNSSDLQDVDEHIEVFAIRSPTIDRSRGLFQKLEHQARILQEHRNELRSMMLTLGRVLDPDLRPRVVHHNKQLNLLIDEWAQLGERLVAGERDLYNEQLSSAEKVSLDRSQARRVKLQDINKEWRRKHTGTWQELSRTSLRLGELARRLESHQAALSPIMLKEHSTNHAKLQEYAQFARDLSRQIASLQARAHVLVENHRRNMLAQQLKDSPYQLTRKRLLLNAQEFLDAEAIFSRRRDLFNHPMKKHAQEDYQQTWNGFRTIAGQVLHYIQQQEKREKDWLDAQLKTFDQLNQKLAELRGRELELERRLGNLTAQAWPSVMDHLSFHINEQQARAKKWMADLQWQRSMNQAQKRAASSKEQERKETDLQESLKDLELEGALHE